MNEPTKEEMLLAMDLLFDPESPATPMFYAIRRLIEEHGGWKKMVHYFLTDTRPVNREGEYFLKHYWPDAHKFLMDIYDFDFGKEAADE